VHILSITTNTPSWLTFAHSATKQGKSNCTPRRASLKTRLHVTLGTTLVLNLDWVYHIGSVYYVEVGEHEHLGFFCCIVGLTLLLWVITMYPAHHVKINLRLHFPVHKYPLWVITFHVHPNLTTTENDNRHASNYINPSVKRGTSTVTLRDLQQHLPM
jgi:hypothetical protein